jgi:hypothetical protein
MSTKQACAHNGKQQKPVSLTMGKKSHTQYHSIIVQYNKPKYKPNSLKKPKDIKLLGDVAPTKNSNSCCRRHLRNG